MAWVVDLDGVVWLGDRAVPGSAQAVEALRRSGQRVVFLTNNSGLPVGDVVAKLGAVGIEAGAEDVITSAQAAAQLVSPGERVLACAGDGVREAVAERGARLVEAGPADAVVVGWHPSFDYRELTAAARAVADGARLIATNEDPTYPTPDGPIPGAGAILAAVATAAQAKPVVAGKPHQPVVDLVRSRLGGVEMVVGDRPSTDGLLARRLGASFGLVLTGVVRPGHGPLDPEPDVEAADLAALVEMKVAGPG
jgi:HAD superfamily hydrolase (TIGR01450 family)